MFHIFHIFSVVLVAVCAVWYLQLQGNRVPKLGTDTLRDTYDYIIVGGGTAGSVLANRLSEEKLANVLLVEAGDEETNKPMYDVPWNAPLAQMTEADWIYYTEPQKKACLAMKERRMFWPRGKGLGGSTLLNGLVYIRGSKYDFEGWEKLGCPGWGYDDVLPYFLKSESIQVSDDDKYIDRGFHGRSGPLPISDTTYSELGEMFLQAAKEYGFKIKDCNGNGGVNEVFCRMYATVGNGLRASAARSFLFPVADRPNLHITVKSHVQKIIFAGNMAIGVEFIKDGKKHKILATNEILLAAGSVGSPQILMLSGIGPRHQLEALKIPIVADLPVGENLNDHMMFYVKADIDKPISYTPEKHPDIPITKIVVFRGEDQAQFSLDLYRSDKETFKSLPTSALPAQSVSKLIRNEIDALRAGDDGKGPLISNAADEANGFIRTNKESPEKYPDIQFILVSSLAEHGKAFDHFNYRDDINRELFGDIHAEEGTAEGFSVAIALLHPKSRGTIRLKSTDPFDYPVIDPNYLDHPDDVKSLIEGIKIFRKMLETKAMKSIGATFRNEPFSGCTAGFTFDTDEYWECVIRHFTVTIYHPTSTCKMGPESDKTSVVTPTLRVKGIQNLRVIDASIMPFETSGNIVAPVYMIAEKGADLVLNRKSVKKFRKSYTKT